MRGRNVRRSGAQRSEIPSKIFTFLLYTQVTSYTSSQNGFQMHSCIRPLIWRLYDQFSDSPSQMFLPIASERVALIPSFSFFLI